MSLKSNLINVVLVETSHPGNIGSVARAMKTMGLSRLSLVNPRKFPSGDANALAGNALDVLENATVYDSIEEAIADSTFVYATSSRNRTIQWPTVNSEEGANKIVDQSNSKKEVSILFGREDRGLTNEELQLANTHIEIPANPEYPVLNVAYVLLRCFHMKFLKRHIKQIQGIGMTTLRLILKIYKCLLIIFIDTAVAIDVIKPENPKKIISRIKRMFSRLHPDEMEASFMRGFLSAINKKIK
jgi:tRNA (cytidine32/uridine32-2'-O)-methyltransferase